MIAALAHRFAATPNVYLRKLALHVQQTAVHAHPSAEIMYVTVLKPVNLVRQTVALAAATEYAKM